MKGYLTFKQYQNFYEGFDIIDNKLIFNAPPSSDRSISSAFGKGKQLTPYTKKISDDLISYSLYQAKTTNATEILKAIKSADYSNDDVKKFLKRSSIYATRILRDLNVDVIVTPQSSSDLTKEFVKEIQSRTNYEIIIDAFRKRIDLTKIEIDKTHPKITPNIIKSMESTIRLAIRRGNLSIKMFAVPYRKFVKNMFEVTDEKIYKKVENKNVIIIDDIMTSGTTTSNIYDILKINGANTVTALTIFKSSK